MSEVIEHILSPDGHVRITIHERADGHFECSLDKFYVDDFPEHNHHMEYWATTRRWGIYDSAATAKREASTEFPWMTDGNAANGN
jgi:hypothetical protein